MYDNQHTVGLYMDEGSRYVTLQNNVLQDTGVWAFTNASSTNNTNDNSFPTNWYNSGSANVATGSPHNNVLSGNVQVSGTSWPAGAQEVISQAGVITNSGTGTARISAVGAGKCLDDNNSSTTLGTQQEIWDCNGGANQAWTRTSAGQTPCSAAAASCAWTRTGSGTTNGTKVVLWTCNGQANQQWNSTPTALSPVCSPVSAWT